MVELWVQAQIHMELRAPRRSREGSLEFQKMWLEKQAHVPQTSDLSLKATTESTLSGIGLGAWRTMSRPQCSQKFIHMKNKMVFYE